MTTANTLVQIKSKETLAHVYILSTHWLDGKRQSTESMAQCGLAGWLAMAPKNEHTTLSLAMNQRNINTT